MKKIVSIFLAAILTISLTACGNKTVAADLKAVMADMKKTITNTEMMDLGEDSLMTNYGIDKSWVKQFAVYIDSTGTKGDEIVLMEGKDADSTKKIKEKLDLRYSQKESEMQGYMPEDFAILKKCKVNQNGNYVSLIVSPQYESLEKIYNDALK